MFQVGCFQPFRKPDRSQRAAEAQRTGGDTEQSAPRAVPSAGVGGGTGRGPAPPARPASRSHPGSPRQAAKGCPLQQGCRRLRPKATSPHLVCSGCRSGAELRLLFHPYFLFTLLVPTLPHRATAVREAQ